MKNSRREYNDPSPRREVIPCENAPEKEEEKRNNPTAFQDCLPGIFAPKLNYEQDQEDAFEDFLEEWGLKAWRNGGTEAA